MNKKALPQNYISSHIAVALATLIWAIAGPVIKVVLSDIPVFALLLFRFTIVCIVVLPYLIIELKKDPIHKGDIPGILALSIAGQSSIAIAFLAFDYTTALDAAIIGIIGTVLTFVAGRIFYNEVITKKELIGIIISSIGTLYIIVEPALIHETGVDIGQRVLGNVLMFVYQLAWPIYIVLGKYLMGNKSKEVNKIFKLMRLKRLSKEYHPNTITFVSFFVGLATFIPLALIEAFTSSSGPNLNFTSISGLLYLALFSSIVAYGLYQWGLKYIEAQETAIYAYLGPILTVPFAYMLLGEIPTQSMIAGCVIIAIGVAIAEKYKS